MRQALSKVTDLYTHSKTTVLCPDGVASALIIKRAIPHIRVHFLRYNTPEHRELQAHAGMIFCDLTPPADRVQEFVQVGAICLDHHAQAKHIVEAFGALGVFADEKAHPGVSGATLAHDVVWLSLYTAEGSVQRLGRLAGIRDTWQQDSMEWWSATYLAQVLVTLPYAYLESLQTHKVLDLIPLGQALYDERLERLRSLSDSAIFLDDMTFPHGPHGGRRWGVIKYQGVNLRVAVVPTDDVSDVADMLRSKAHIIAGFQYRHEPHAGSLHTRTVYSLRAGLPWDPATSNRINVGEVASALGGGGHTSAAGFTLLNEDDSPYSALLHSLEKALGV